MRNPTVLVIDDEPDICDLFMMYLESNYDVTTASEGLLACRLIRTFPFNAIITDKNMACYTGGDILDVTKNCQPGTPVILVTGECCSQFEKDALRRSGFYEVLSKPDEVSCLNKVVGSAAKKTLPRPA